MACATGDMLPPGDMLSSGSELLLRAMSGSIALLQPGSTLMSGVPVITEGHEDAQGLGCHMWPYWCLGAIQQELI